MQLVIFTGVRYLGMEYPSNKDTVGDFVSSEEALQKLRNHEQPYMLSDGTMITYEEVYLSAHFKKI